MKLVKNYYKLPGRWCVSVGLWVTKRILLAAGLARQRVKVKIFVKKINCHKASGWVCDEWMFSIPLPKMHKIYFSLIIKKGNHES